MLPLLFIPSVLITLMFFLSGFEKIIRFPISTSKFAKKMRLPLTLAQLIIVVVIMLEIIAPSIIMAYTYSKNVSLVPFFKPLVVLLLVPLVLVFNKFSNKSIRINSIIICVHLIPPSSVTLRALASRASMSLRSIAVKFSIFPNKESLFSPPRKSHCHDDLLIIKPECFPDTYGNGIFPFFSVILDVS